MSSCISQCCQDTVQSGGRLVTLGYTRRYNVKYINGSLTSGETNLKQQLLISKKTFLILKLTYCMNANKKHLTLIISPSADVNVSQKKLVHSLKSCSQSSN